MSSLELLPFQGPSLSFAAQAITLTSVLTVLLVLRQSQESRKRRRVAVWVFDIGRVLISYAIAHVLLYIFIPFINTASISNNVGSNVVSSEASGGTRLEKRDHQGAAIASQQLDLLTFTALDIFPGLPLLYVLYTSVLQAAYHAQFFWFTTLARLRLRRDVSSRCLYSIYTIPPPGRDHVDQDLANVSGIKKRYASLADTGFVSGNYGAPVRIQWLVQQTALLALCIFALRAALFYIVTGSGSASGSTFVQGLRYVLFEWLVDTKDPGHGDYILHAIVLPSVLYSARFAFADYLLRYRSSVANGKIDSGLVLPLYSDSGSIVEDTQYRDALPQHLLHVNQQHIDVESSLQFTPALLPQAMTLKKTGVVRRTASPIHLPQPIIDPVSEPEAETTHISETTSTELPISEASTIAAPTPVENNIEENIEAFVDDIYGLGQQALTTVKQLPETSEELKQAINTVKSTVEKVELQQKFDAVRKTVENAELKQKFDAVKKTVVESAEIKQALDSVKKTVEAADFSQVRDNLSLAGSRIKPLLFSGATSVGLGLGLGSVGAPVTHASGSPLLDSGSFQMPGLYNVGSRFGGLSPRVQTPTTPTASFTPISAAQAVMGETAGTLDLGIDGVDTEEEVSSEEEFDNEEEESSDEDVD
jgi:hypothetical protein